jgi:hypothetical protein
MDVPEAPDAIVTVGGLSVKVGPVGVAVEASPTAKPPLRLVNVTVALATLPTMMNKLAGLLDMA